MLEKQIDGNTYTQCDCCKKFNILLEYPSSNAEVGLLVADQTYLLCPECGKKFKKIMEDFIDAERSAV